jgi:hypothetical protein
MDKAKMEYYMRLAIREGLQEPYDARRRAFRRVHRQKRHRDSRGAQYRP